MFKLHDQNPSHFKWISYVKSIFDDTGLSFIWNDQIPMGKMLPISNFPLKQEDGTGCLNMKEFVIFVETELEMNSIICSSVKNRKLKPLGKSSFLYIIRNIQLS